MSDSTSAFVALRKSRKFWAAALPCLYVVPVYTLASFYDWRYSFVAGGVPCLLFCAVIVGIAIEDMAAKWPEPAPAPGPQLTFNYSTLTGEAKSPEATDTTTGAGPNGD